MIGGLRWITYINVSLSTFIVALLTLAWIPGCHSPSDMGKYLSQIMFEESHLSLTKVRGSID